MSAAPIGDAELDELFAPLRPFAVLILAVSGGADSLAMMHLVARWSERFPRKDRKLVVATVDHGLRPESRREAVWVAEQAQAIGLDHETLTWQGDKPTTGLQDAAREARYRLLAELGWRLAGSGPVAIVTAHTEDDQAETFLMRLARGSGLDGLTGMSASRDIDGESACTLVRPLLRVAGSRLRATLEADGLAWIEDPSNEQARFERVRLRKAHAKLRDIGLTNQKVALSARRLNRAREALEAAATDLQAETALDVHGGIYGSLRLRAFQDAAEELRLRLMTRLISAFGGQEGPVRLAKLESLIWRMNAPAFEAATLGGCMVMRHADELRVLREPGRVALPEIALAPGGVAVWDRRFRVATAQELGATACVRALGGAGFAKLRQQLEGAVSPPPASAAATLPSFWLEGELIAVPQLSYLSRAGAGWDKRARLCSAEFLWYK